MITQSPPRPAPQITIEKLVKERYSQAAAVFWAGSVSRNKPTPASDLDLVIVFAALPNAYREAFIYEGWPIDAFIHDKASLRYFFEKADNTLGVLALPKMILEGIEITTPSNFSQEVINLARNALANGPPLWSQERIEKERFFITDTLDDIKSPATRDEQIASAARFYEMLGQFYFRSQNQWCASGKSLLRYLQQANAKLADEFTQSFATFFQTGATENLQKLTVTILAPYGGLLWDGYKSVAPKEYKSFEKGALESIITRLELSLLEPQVRRSVEQLNALIADEFIEVGSSGKTYSKQDILTQLPQEPPRHQVTANFMVKELVGDTVLLTYQTCEENRTTKRTSIWKQILGNWQIVFHQGTKVISEKD